MTEQEKKKLINDIWEANGVYIKSIYVDSCGFIREYLKHIPIRDLYIGTEPNYGKVIHVREFGYFLLDDYKKTFWLKKNQTK